jgi:ABC-2 type transport system ATP-binding protein
VLAEVSQIADDVVVIHHGRSVAQAPLAEILGGSDGGMKVVGPDVPQLAPYLQQQGWNVTGAGNECVVRGHSGEEIGRIVAQRQFVISELTPVGASLEDIFIQLTGTTGGPS